MKPQGQTPATILGKAIKAMLTEFILHRDDLEVVVDDRHGLATFRIRCHPGDVGRVVGSKGAHFKALQTIGRLFADKHQIDVEFMPVEENGKGKPDRYNPFKAAANWRKAEILTMLEAVCWNIFRADQAVGVRCNDGTTVSEIDVEVARDEPTRLIDAADAALRVIFNAIGKANGRTLVVRVRPGEIAEPRQPTTSSRR